MHLCRPHNTAPAPGGPLDSACMEQFWRYAKLMMRYRGTVLIAVACAIVGATGLGVGVIGAYPIMRSILDPGSEGNDLPALARDLNGELPAWLQISEGFIASLPTGEFTALVALIAGLGVLTVIGGICNFTHAALSLRVVYRTIADIRRHAFNHVIRLPLATVLAEGTSDPVSRIVNDTTQLASGMSAMLSKAVAQTAKGVATFIAALVLDWRLTLVTVPVAFVVATVIRKLSKRVRRATRKALAHQAELYAASNEALQGLRVVKVHTTERLESGRFQRINRQVLHQLLRARTARALMSPVNEVITLFAIGGLAIFAGKLSLDGHIADPERLLLALAALGISAASLKPLTGIINEIQVGAAAAGRIAELGAAEPEPGHDAKLPRLGRHARSIEFRGVSFTYPGGSAPALHEIDLTVRHGERIAVVGPNGSGKTTLLALVPRLFDVGRGSVLIDGQDIRAFGVRSLRRQIGVVTQETVIFHSTVRENIAYGARGVSEEQILDAAQQARAMDFIKRLPQGLDTVIGERGGTLSGGQRQRIAIARAILRDPAILILDEATSMIDADSEAKIAEAIAEFSSGRTCLIVAHRLSTVIGADRIVVMDRGRIVDIGTHEQLLDRCETYRLIARRQLVGGADAE